MGQIGYLRGNCLTYPFDLAFRHFRFSGLEKTWKGWAVHWIIGLFELAIPFSFIVAEVDRLWHTKRFFPPPVFFPADVQAALREVGYLKRDLPLGLYPGAEAFYKMGIHSAADLRTLGIFGFSDALKTVRTAINIYKDLDALLENEQQAWQHLSGIVQRLRALNPDEVGLVGFQERVQNRSENVSELVKGLKNLLGPLDEKKCIGALKGFLRLVSKDQDLCDAVTRQVWQEFAQRLDLDAPTWALFEEIEGAEKRRIYQLITKYVYQPKNAQAFQLLSQIYGLQGPETYQLQGRVTLSQLWARAQQLGAQDTTALFRLRALAALPEDPPLPPPKNLPPEFCVTD